MLAFIKEEESKYEDRYVPAVKIRKPLDLNHVGVRKANGQGHKGYLFDTIARILEDENLLESKKEQNKQVSYRSKTL
ncbi:MAG: hypothetical protein HQK91_00395 [Nitrospirae bacterium]|nr:hypothetical protein [Nitrospirota bacterium]MBF0539895.1 hypothetical protein [Nitrospirota bacterium]